LEWLYENSIANLQNFLGNNKTPKTLIQDQIFKEFNNTKKKKRFFYFGEGGWGALMSLYYMIHVKEVHVVSLLIV
jgi:hypothetical protein